MISWFQKEKRDEVEITISNRTVIRVLVLVIASLLFVALLRQAAYALTLIFVAFFLALALNGPVSWFAKRMPGKMKGNRAIGTGVSFLIIVLVLGGFLATIIPPLVRQTSNFLNVAPQLVEDVRDENSSVGVFIRENNLEEHVDSLSSELSERVGDIGGTAVSTVSRIGGSVFAILTVLVLTFMMLVEGPIWIKLFRELVPDHNRDHIDGLMSEMYKVVRGYVNGQVLLAATAAALILVPLLILEISYPVALMVIVFFCALIPMVGHYIGAAIVTFVALFTSPWDALVILGYYILYQQIENYVVQPSVQANATNMSPLLVFTSVIVGVSFGGLLGGLVAIPVAGCLRVLLLDYLQSRHIIDAKATRQYNKATTEEA